MCSSVCPSAARWGSLGPSALGAAEHGVRPAQMGYPMTRRIMLALLPAFLAGPSIAQQSPADNSELNATTDRQPYYAFYPSAKGQGHKRFQHNIFGLSVDIPTNWIFGVNGTPPTAVLLLYPEGLAVSSFSPNYETIELGQLLPVTSNLEAAQEFVMSGMKSKHPSIALISPPTKAVLNRRPAISWTFRWPSKTGYTVVEYITLVQDENRIRSISVRTTRPDFPTRKKFYDEILATVNFLSPKY